MRIGVPKETTPREHRIALVPATVASLKKIPGVDVFIESGAGLAAGFTDDDYAAQGAQLTQRAELFERCTCICQVWCPCAAEGGGEPHSPQSSPFNAGHTIIGHCDPLAPEKRPAIERLAGTGATTFAMELMPRITRAQAMDALSSQATIGGYKAVILAADRLPKLFPMLMTAAGTLAPARVLVIGAGVAGLQAIATAKRLGAVVSAYDIRPAVKEQIESLGARFVELGLEDAAAEGAGGYARARDEAFYARQRDLLGKVVGESDVVVSTAAVPGRPSPLLITAEAARSMRSGSVIVDLAAQRGGNCELTRADEVVTDAGITILGPTNLPSTVPHHASQMYSRNIEAFLKHLMKDGELDLDRDDEIIQETLLTRGGEIVHSRLRDPATA